MKLKKVTTLTITEEEQSVLGELFFDLVDDGDDAYSLLSGLYNGDLSKFGIELIVKSR